MRISTSTSETPTPELCSSQGRYNISLEGRGERKGGGEEEEGEKRIPVVVHGCRDTRDWSIFRSLRTRVWNDLSTHKVSCDGEVRATLHCKSTEL